MEAAIFVERRLDPLLRHEAARSFVFEALLNVRPFFRCNIAFRKIWVVKKQFVYDVRRRAPFQLGAAVQFCGCFGGELKRAGHGCHADILRRVLAGAVCSQVHGDRPSHLSRHL